MRYYYTYNNTGTNENLLFSQNKTIEKKQNNILLYVKTNHLGNVRATIKATGSTGEYQLTTRTDYYAFGGAQPGRTYNLNTYRYNYQGQESAVNSRWQAFDLRMHNSDLGRWFAPDPYGQFHSPYVSMSNNPINGTDPDGGYYIGNDASRWRGYGQTDGKKFNNGWDQYVYDSQVNDANYKAAYQIWLKYVAIDGYNTVAAQDALKTIKRQYGKLNNTNYGALSNLNHNMLMSSDNAVVGSRGGVNADESTYTGKDQSNDINKQTAEIAANGRDRTDALTETESAKALGIFIITLPTITISSQQDVFDLYDVIEFTRYNLDRIHAMGGDLTSFGQSGLNNLAQNGGVGWNRAPLSLAESFWTGNNINGNHYNSNGTYAGPSPSMGFPPIPAFRGGNLFIKGFGNVNKQLFHQVIKPDILGAAGNFSKTVGKNPDILINNGNIFLQGTGPFKGKMFDTGLDPFNFFNH